MNESNRENGKTQPGIPEALHPETGNGALLETDRHKVALRLPDPLKAFDDMLGYKSVAEAEAEAKAEAKAEVEVEAKAEAEAEAEAEVGAKEEVKIEAIVSVFEEKDEGATVGTEDNKPKGKSPKTGKRIRKAVKSVQIQQAEDLSRESAAISTKGADIPLSPFTQWLKGLRGSEYVHPYDDDFAIEQSGHLTREGMSETFADLLAAQGHRDRAKEMYQRLMEKYPEKSSFFAAKIKALE